MMQTFILIATDMCLEDARSDQNIDLFREDHGLEFHVEAGRSNLPLAARGLRCVAVSPEARDHRRRSIG